ncbi:MAG: hypothetical protein V2B19_01785 [Pseudomonadota bacterium]
MCYRNSNSLICLLAGAMAAAMLFAVGCGKKAMPVAPNRIAPAAVSNFKGELKEGRVLLTWSLPGKSDDKSGVTQSVPVAEVRVYRSKLSLAAGGCKHCPPRFEVIAKLAPVSGGTGGMRFSDTLETGFRYTYKVVLIGENDVMSPDSDLLDVTY